MADDFHDNVFLSHSAKDKAVVRPLAERLRADGPYPKAEHRRQTLEVILLPSSFFLRPLLCAFGSDWAQLEAGTFRFRDLLNTERRFIPLRLDDPVIQGSSRDFIAATVAAAEFELFRLSMLWQSSWHDLRATARRMEGVARPDSAGTFSAQRGTLRAIPGHGRQP